MKSFAYALVLSAAAALFTGGCTQKRSPVPVQPANGGSGGDSMKRGTSDSGGGTGVEGKMFESYIVDPTTLPAYKEHLAPRFANMNTSSQQDSLEVAFHLKTWYLAPVELAKIEKDLLGVSFMQNSTTQIARHKLREIWISKPIYDAMMPDTLAQATTLAHEWVMGLYMMKFMKFSDICRSTMVDPKERCGSDPDAFDDLIPPEPVHVLTDEDNENIRFVTDWFMRTSLKPFDQKEFMRVLIARGFDQRFFDPGRQEPDQETKNLIMSRKQFIETLQGSKLTKLMPDQCTGVTLGKTSPCTLDFKDTGTGLGVSLNVPGEPPLEFETYLSDQIHLSESGDVNSLEYYTITLFTRQPKYRVGDRARYLALLFDKTRVPGQVELRSVVLRTGVITSIDKTRDPVCFIRVPKVETLLDDGLMIRRAGFKPLILERYYAGSALIGICNAGDVD